MIILWSNMMLVRIEPVCHWGSARHGPLLLFAADACSVNRALNWGSQLKAKQCANQPTNKKNSSMQLSGRLIKLDRRRWRWNPTIGLSIHWLIHWRSPKSNPFDNIYWLLGRVITDYSWIAVRLILSFELKSNDRLVRLPVSLLRRL